MLTFPISTAIACGVSILSFKIVKSKICNRMEDDFLTNSLIMYIEKEIVEKFSIDSIIDDFRDMQERRVPFWCIQFKDLLYWISTTIEI